MRGACARLLVVALFLCCIAPAHAAAKDAIVAATLSLGAEREAYSPTVLVDHVMGQNLAAGGQVPERTPVEVVVSKGVQPPVAVPNVVGQTQDAATAAIAGVGLVVGTVTHEFRHTVPAGKVISQDPVAGTELLPGTAVNLLVSNGPPVYVPDVVGVVRAPARARLVSARLTVGAETEEYHPTMPAECVVRQNPASGVAVRPGSPVDLVISKGINAAPTAWYVNAASTAAAPDGTSWATAFPAIQSAVDAAAPCDELWVAAGTYTGTGDQAVSLKDGMTLYGGFAGSETARDQRDWKANATVIDGQQARRCVTTAISNTVDGFTLQNGSSHYGAGTYGGTTVNCSFVECVASQEGGGMFEGTATNCTFAGNTANNGGGMSCGAATDCVFTGNSADRYGGGMLRGIATDCTFTGNSAVQYGGGMSLGTATNCVFTRNLSHNGGGMSDSIATNCTFRGNTASGTWSCTVTNCILWGNSPTDIGPWSHASYSCLAEATPGVGNIVGNPGFVNPLAGDFRLRAGSPCIDVGTADGAPTSDLLGRTRPQGAGVDIGAYEHYAGDDNDVVLPQAVLRVNAASTAPVPDGLAWETAFPTLQAAANLAGYGSEIWVARGTYTAGDGEQVVLLTGGTSVYGGFAGSETERGQRDWTANHTTIDGQGARRCVAASTATTVDGFTLQNGGPPADGYYYPLTGAMYSGTAINCVFKGNIISGMASGTAINCIFTGNNGGGMSGGTATNCIFTGNYSGGAMYGGTAVNCIIWGNGFRETSYSAVSYSCLPVATPGVGNVVGNPLFVNPWAGDFRLRAGSPCVDTGTADGAPATDLAGRVRPLGAGVDMGAYEYYAGDDDHAVLPPDLLRVNCASTAAAPDGLTWETAFPTLQAAADLAAYGTEIWVAQGTYTVADGAQVLRLNEGTALYGGFTGMETARVQRDRVAHQTIIDGQGVRRCVTANTTSSIDGFIVQNGNSADVAGGMYCGTAANCLFSGNAAGFNGGGVYFGVAVNCVFRGNSAVSRGGGMHGGTATNCVFARNTAALSGGGFSEGSAFNCTITRNSGGGIGGIITITNCIVWGNNPDRMDCTATYSCLRVANPGVGNIVGDPLYVNPAAGDYRLQPGSPCIDMGTANGALGADLLGVPRPQGAGVDMGAYEVVVPVAVPELVGLARAAAKDAIVAAQLNVGAESEEYHPTVAVDHVIRQTPAGGAQTPQWGVVDLVISKGPQPFPVPDLVGRAQADALTAITDAGLAVGKISQECSATVPVGVVVSQTPAVGEMVPPGTAVSMVVSLGAEPVDIDTAKQQLAEAYDTADTNGDGALSFDESAAAVPGLTAATFDGLDTNGDGQLSPDELGVDDGAGCAGCQGRKGLLGPAGAGKHMGDLFLTALGALGLAMMSTLRRP